MCSFPFFSHSPTPQSEANLAKANKTIAARDEEIKQTKDVLAETRGTLKETEGTLENTQNDLAKARNRIRDLENQLAKTEVELDEEHVRLKENQTELRHAKADIGDLKDEVAARDAKIEEQAATLANQVERLRGDHDREMDLIQERDTLLEKKELYERELRLSLARELEMRSDVYFKRNLQPAPVGNPHLKAYETPLPRLKGITTMKKRRRPRPGGRLPGIEMDNATAASTLTESRSRYGSNEMYESYPAREGNHW